MKPYVSATADDTIAEVNKLTVTDSRQKFVVNISRKRRDFTVAPAKFNETDADNAAFSKLTYYTTALVYYCASSIPTQR